MNREILAYASYVLLHIYGTKCFCFPHFSTRKICSFLVVLSRNSDTREGVTREVVTRQVVSHADVEVLEEKLPSIPDQRIPEIG